MSTREKMKMISKMEALELAWGLIANAYGGDWALALDDWREAAIRWRDECWHPLLTASEQDAFHIMHETLIRIAKHDRSASAAHARRALEQVDREAP